VRTLNVAPEFLNKGDVFTDDMIDG